MAERNKGSIKLKLDFFYICHFLHFFFSFHHLKQVKFVSLYWMYTFIHSCFICTKTSLVQCLEGVHTGSGWLQRVHASQVEVTRKAGGRKLVRVGQTLQGGHSRMLSNTSGARMTANGGSSLLQGVRHSRGDRGQLLLCLVGAVFSSATGGIDARWGNGCGGTTSCPRVVRVRGYGGQDWVCWNNGICGLCNCVL